MTSADPLTSTHDLVGRSADNAKRSPEDIEHVTAVTISRDDVIISSITLFTEAKVDNQLDLGNAKVTGNLKANGSEIDFLQLDWSLPLTNQTGRYQCNVSGVTKSGHHAVMKVDLEVKATDVDKDDLLSEIHDLKKLLLQQKNFSESTFAAQQIQLNLQQSTIIEQQKKIDAEKSRNDRQQMTISQQQANIDSLTKELTRVSHVEHGVVDCRNSKEWTDGAYKAPWNHNHRFNTTKSVRVNFASPYVKPPVVHLSIYSFFNYPDVYEQYAAVVEQVDVDGFTLRCMTWDDTRFKVNDMDVSWLGVASS